MRKSQGSLAGWLFADLTLVIAVVMLSSWTINQKSATTATVTLEKYNLLLLEKNNLETEVEELKAEVEGLKAEVEDLNAIVEELEAELAKIKGGGEKGVKLEPVVVIISASERDSTQSVFEKIEKALEQKSIDKTQQFSFALIFGGTAENPSEEMLEDAKLRATKIGERLRGTETEDGWPQFNREKYVRAFHDVGLGDGRYKIELYPSN